ncbi:MAG: thioredoxin family protein [Bacteroidales bacterium]|nr:thioredoxin family protein [Bacteroidales bacterium]MCF8387590.1 thioredoxin family protein [Bacteroidales bacterium]MCF8398833.1 thioredoxin family protein [Bacteroidales bacterium]
MKITTRNLFLYAGIAFTFLFLTSNGFAQSGIFEPVKWEFSSKKISDTEAELIFRAEIENKWHLYSQDIPMSPPATGFIFEENDTYKRIGEVIEVSEAIEEYDPNFEMELKYFAEEAVFKQKVELTPGVPVTIKGYVEYMCCDDTRCLPPTEEDFRFSFNQQMPQQQSGILEPVKWEKSLERISDDTYDLHFKANIDPGYHLYTQEKFENGPLPTEFIFEESKNYKLLGNPEPDKAAVTEFDEVFELEIGYYENEVSFTQRIEIETQKVFNIKGEIAYMVCNDVGCVSLYEDFTFAFEDGTPADAKAVLADAEEDFTGSNKKTLWGFFILSFVFGLIAILTPCVFPMIPMTVSFFMKESGNKGKARRQAVVYGISIIVIYVLVGSLLAIFLGPGFANFLSTHWLPNILFFLIFMIFAASFFGMFELTIPNWMVNKSDKQADRGGFVGAIFMAVTLVLVSFSCTGPIVGMILVESAGGLVLKPIVGMLGFSLAFALPFTLFAFFPQWLSGLPKSGGWLNSVKVILGFIELALGLKFLSVADQVYHWGILDREVYIAFWIVIFTLMGFYLLGKLKFAHDTDLKFISVPRLTLSIITFSFVVYLIPGMFGAPLKALSGYLPPQSTHDFDINAIVRKNVQLYSGSMSEKASISNTRDLKETCEDPKYSDFLHLPHGLEGYFDFEQGMRCAKQLNKPIFIDFTGHGCVNCREMEANVWADPEVLKRLRDDYVIIALYVDDKTKLPEQDWIKSEYDGKLKKSIGKKYADFQISRFGVNAQPFYVLIDHKGEKLVQPRAYDLDVDEFVDFLDRGLKEFKRRSN